MQTKGHELRKARKAARKEPRMVQRRKRTENGRNTDVAVPKGGGTTEKKKEQKRRVGVKGPKEAR